LNISTTAKAKDYENGKEISYLPQFSNNPNSPSLPKTSVVNSLNTIRNEFLNKNNYPQNSGYDNFIQNNEVQITSFLATDFYHGGIDANNKNPVANFSQSVAYALNSSDRIGMELGYTEFSYVDKATILIPSYSTPPVNSSVEVLQSGVYTEYVEYTMKVNRQKQMFWERHFMRILFSLRMG